MLSANDIGRYHFRMTDNHDGGTFDCDVNFESDLLIIESDCSERARVSNILGRAQREDFLLTLERCGILALRSEKWRDGDLVVKSEGTSNGRPFKVILPIGENTTLRDFAMYLLSISQYIGMKDSIVDKWRTTIVAAA